MVIKSHIYRVVFLFLFSITGLRALSQPTLPDLAGAVDKGIVVLSWNCPYNSIKSITVQRSSDSTANYAAIGNVKQLDKGLQAFVDGHPTAGKNFYRLIILFKSGLSWTSNRCTVSIDKSAVPPSQVKLPPNDSLQHFVVTEEKSVPTAKTKNKTADTATMPAHKLSISYDADVMQPDIKTGAADNQLPVQPRHKIVISFDEPDINPVTFIKSRFINTDPATGYLNMILPDDVNQHHYSVKFYNQANHVVIEVPRIKASQIIIDRRNFQHKGVYKFVLRRDFTELETGYVSIE
jgi:hypothetical protein